MSFHELKTSISRVAAFPLESRGFSFLQTNHASMIVTVSNFLSLDRLWISKSFSDYLLPETYFLAGITTFHFFFDELYRNLSQYLFIFFLSFSLFQCIIVGLAGFALAEPPSGYSYSRPSGGGGYSFGGGGGGGGGFSHGGGGGYTSVSTGYQTSEGASIDGALLEQIRQILLREEQNSGFGGGIGGGYAPSSSYGAPSSQYGVPSSSYGVPSYQTRVVGIDLDGIRQAIQVAQFNQVSHAPGGYPSGPSGSYGVPSRPSGSYGAPY